MIINTDLIYPIGAIYLSVSATNPAILFGGKWEQIKDRFLLAAGDTYAIRTTGGEATHKLTVAEMPSHTHWTKEIAPGLYAGWGNKSQDGWITQALNASNGGTWETAATGGNQAHNNMPPYYTVYMWERVA